jgi:N-acetylneuraminic acid mutarotase
VPTLPIATITWSPAAPAPLGRFEAQSAVVGDTLYVVGGYTDAPIIPRNYSLHAYHPQTDTWSALPDSPRPLTHAGVTSDERYLYFAGGVVGATNPLELAKFDAIAEVWRFDTVTETWSALPDLPQPRGAGALELLGRTLHFFGGTGTDRYSSVGDHWTLSLDEVAQGGGTWQVAAPLPNARNHLASAVLGGKIYAIGGQHGHNETLVTQRDVHVWDPERPDRWQQVASLPYGVGHAGNTALVYGGNIYLIGGEVVRFKSTDAVLVYDPVADRWEATTPFLTAEHSLLGGVIGDEIIVTGGSSLSTRTLRGALSFPESAAR